MEATQAPVTPKPKPKKAMVVDTREGASISDSDSDSDQEAIDSRKRKTPPQTWAPRRHPQAMRARQHTPERLRAIAKKFKMILCTDQCNLTVSDVNKIRAADHYGNCLCCNHELGEHPQEVWDDIDVKDVAACTLPIEDLLVQAEKSRSAVCPSCLSMIGKHLHRNTLAKVSKHFT